MIISNKAQHNWLLSGWISSGQLVLLVLLVAACDNNNGSSRHHNRLQQPAHRVEVVSVEKKPVNLTQTVSGTLEAVTRIRIYNEESGRITKLPYHEGDSVKKGSLLVQLDNELLKTDVAKAKANSEQEKLDLDRLKKLLPKNISTEEEVAQARTILNLALAEEKRQRTRLKRTSIKAPIDGLITERFYEPGDQLANLSHIHTIIDPSSLQLKASIAERWIPLIKKNQDVALTIDALGDRNFSAKIVRIHPTINAQTHKGVIEIRLDPAPENAKVGQFARASIALKSIDRLIVPVHAIHFEPEGAFVYRIVKNENNETVVEKVSFEQGQQFGEVTEVLSGLEAGDRIVSRGYLGLREGKKVDVIDTTKTTDSTTEASATKTDKH
jgi:RND family efflux transporter MFP subunit